MEAYAIVLHMKSAPNSTTVSVRVNIAERALLESAAETAQTTLSDFVRRKAVDAAEIDVLGRAVVTIPAKDWDAFEAWLDRPASLVPALVDLARKMPSWDR